METKNIAGIARAAVLTQLSVSTYTGRKMDKRTAEEVATAKSAGSKRAVSTYKSLFADSAELQEINSQAGYIRQLHYRLTSPWDDAGTRLLPTKHLLSYQKDMSAATDAFNDAVTRFLNRYDTLVSVAAFKLGDLFDRTEYPTRTELASKFGVSIAYTPLPTSGDFRLDIETEVMDELAAQYSADADKRVEQVMRDAWDRLHTTLTHMSEKLRAVEDGEKKPRLHATMVENALDVCSLLTGLNIMSDPTLEEARKQLEQTLSGVDIDSLRESDEVKAATKKRVDTILDSLNWGA